MSKPFRTIKKSAAKSSVSRKTLRSAVKKTSSAAKKGTSTAAKKSARAAKKSGQVVKRGAAKKSVKKSGKNSAGSRHAVETKPELINQYLHQPSIIRPATVGAWPSLRTAFGSKAR